MLTVDIFDSTLFNSKKQMAITDPSHSLSKIQFLGLVSHGECVFQPTGFFEFPRCRILVTASVLHEDGMMFVSVSPGLIYHLAIVPALRGPRERQLNARPHQASKRGR